MSSLYLHIPFCEHKCIYCDFYSIESLDPMERFLEALKQEIAMYAAHADGETFETIFFGGGTPSLLAPKRIREILKLLSSTFRVESGAEVTMEANPGTVDLEKLTGYREAGINRLSFGVQSFHDDDLKFLTRIHSSDQAKQALRMAGEAGFDNTSIDLIFSLPNQTMERWKENLRQALELGTKHISAYSLIVEQNTPLFRMVETKQVSPLPVETEAEMYSVTMDVLREAGFEHYEVSNYATPGFRSKHNCNYWNHSNYLGFGPSAHSFWNNRRWWNSANINAYCEKISSGIVPVVGSESLTSAQLIDEAVMLGLRSDGVQLQKLKSIHDVDLPGDGSGVIGHLISDHLATLNNGTLRLTDRGYLLCDEITELLLSSLVAT